MYTFDKMKHTATLDKILFEIFNFFLAFMLLRHYWLLLFMLKLLHFITYIIKSAYLLTKIQLLMFITQCYI